MSIEIVRDLLSKLDTVEDILTDAYEYTYIDSVLFEELMSVRIELQNKLNRMELEQQKSLKTKRAGKIPAPSAN